MKLVDVGDSKSPGSDTVPVRVRPRALWLRKYEAVLPFCFYHEILTQESYIYQIMDFSNGNQMAEKNNVRFNLF